MRLHARPRRMTAGFVTGVLVLCLATIGFIGAHCFSWGIYAILDAAPAASSSASADDLLALHAGHDMSGAYGSHLEQLAQQQARVHADHGWMGTTVVSALLGAVLALLLVVRCMVRHPGTCGQPLLGRCAPLRAGVLLVAPCAYVAVELFQRLTHGAEAALPLALVVVGTVVQPIIALGMLRLAGVTLSAVERIARVIRTSLGSFGLHARASITHTVGYVLTWVPIREPLAGTCAGRAPPALVR